METEISEISNENGGNIMKLLIVIVNAGFVEEVMEIAREAGIKGATILNARGEGEHIHSFMGITVDAEKEMIMSVVNEAVSDRAMAEIKEKAGIKTPAHGVCFTLPVEKWVGLCCE